MYQVEQEFSGDAVEAVLHALRQNNMQAQYVACKEAAADAVAALLHPGDRVAVGGSATLKQTGVLDMLRSGAYDFIDRYEPGLTEAGQQERLLEAFRADAFLCSANAITRQGEIYQVDGLSNRIAPLVFGPGSVILVAGINKLVTSLPQAVHRVRSVTALAIVTGRGLNAPCAKLGRCIALENEDMAAGCMCDARRCCNFLVLGRQRIPGRIKVILVGEPLGL